MAAARSGRGTGILWPPTPPSSSERSLGAVWALFQVPSCRRETTASADHPDECAHRSLRQLRCWLRPGGKAVGAGWRAEEEGNVNCINRHLTAASVKGGEGREGRAEKL